LLGFVIGVNDEILRDAFKFKDRGERDSFLALIVHKRERLENIMHEQLRHTTVSMNCISMLIFLKQQFNSYL
jgi:hypothetical protein